MDISKIDMIVWSKNRACQLDLLLRSTKDHFKNIGKIFILWKADSDEYLGGYKKLMRKDHGLNMSFMNERNFEDDIQTALCRSRSEYILGNSDDNVFIRKIDFDFDFPDKVIAFSLRLGKSINYCLPANLGLDLPVFILENTKILYWNWTKSDERGGWGYPHPVDSHIYEKQYWLELLYKGKFNNPREMEDYMNNHRDLTRPFMMSFTESHLISISANETGQGSNLINAGISLDELNKKFLDNYIISTENIYGIDVNSCHILLDYKLEEE